MRWIFTGDNGMRAGWGVVVFIAMGVAIILAISRLWHIFFGHLLHRETLVTLPAFYLGESIQITGLLGALAVVATIERRPMLSFGWHDSAGWARFGGGLLCGFVALSLCVLILLRMHLLALDAPSAHGTTLWTHAVAWGGLFLLVAIFEESALRGYLQYTLTRGIGFWWSALLLSILFAGIHGSNPGETPVGLITAGAIGMLLCLSLWYTGSLFWAIGFHTAWDWGQSYFYGTSDSGVLLDNRLFSAHPFGNVLLSGGQTGPEGSLLVLPMILVMALLMWLWWGRKTPSPFRGSGWKPASGMTRRNLFSTDTQ
jgi:membrane protease YdiL (CAAX protease family)